jgi:hypothetical protein
MFKKILFLMLFIAPALFAQDANLKIIDSLRQAGAVFTASRIEPYCELNIYSSGQIQIKINEDEYNFSNSLIEKVPEDSTAVYTETENGKSVSVKVSRGRFYDTAGNEFKYSADVSLDGASYKLFGLYLNYMFNPMIPESARGLYNIWAFKTLNGMAIPIQSMIEINLNDEKLLAYNSDLELSADVKISGDKISFYNVKYVSGDKSYFDELKEIDGIEFSYELKGLNLTLDLEKQLILVLVKAD